MADDKKNENAQPTAAEQAEAAGRTPQAMEAAKTPEQHDKASRTEDPPKANPDVDDKPAADANPDEANGEGDSWPNYMSTAGLNPIQQARVEGTPMDGALGGTVLGPRAVRTPTREERKDASLNEAASKRSGSKSK